MGLNAISFLGGLDRHTCIGFQFSGGHDSTAELLETGTSWRTPQGRAVQLRATH